MKLEAALAQASSIAEQPNASKSLSAWYSLAVARMALSQRQFPEATARSQQALALAGTNLKGTLVEGNFTLGLAKALSGATQEGRGNVNRRSKSQPSLKILLFSLKRCWRSPKPSF